MICLSYYSCISFVLHYLSIKYYPHAMSRTMFKCRCIAMYRDLRGKTRLYPRSKVVKRVCAVVLYPTKLYTQACDATHAFHVQPENYEGVTSDRFKGLIIFHIANVMMLWKKLPTYLNGP